MTGGDRFNWDDVGEARDRVSTNLSLLFPLPDTPITDITPYFTDEEIEILHYSDTDAVTKDTLTLQMIDLRTRRELLTSVIARQQRGHGVETRLGNPKQGRFLAD